MPPKPSDVPTIAAANTNQVHKRPKSERVLGRSGDTVPDANYKYDAITDGAASAIYPVVESQIRSFAQNSQALMRVLDELTKIHPFIGAAVAIFKVGVRLELDRRENDKRALALKARMLSRVKDPQLKIEGLTISGRLEGRMKAIYVSIELCGKVCDSYQKQHTAVKFFTSGKWQAQFTEVAQQFADHKAALHEDLQIYVAIEINKISENIDVVMKVIFKYMQSPEERQINSLVLQHCGDGGQDAIENNQLLEEVLAMEKLKDGKGAKRQGDIDEDEAMTVPELQKKVAKDVKQILDDNKSFELKLKAALQKQADEMKDTIKRESDRVIDALRSRGPHERVKDQDIYHVWVEMGWRGSVKAKHLAMALRDHFVDHSRAALAAIRDITDSKEDSSALQKVEEITDIVNRAHPNAPEEDQWTIKYIAVHRVQSLIEALDADASSFVSVNEVNAFTDARPADWSLARWIAYWTYGFEMTTQWYFRRIRKVFVDINNLSKVALPSNTKPIYRFIRSREVVIAEDILSGLRDVEIWDDVDFETHHVFSRFKKYVVETETRMWDSLRGIKYCLDDANTLAIIAGKGRPETFVLPLTFILMRRALWIIEEAGRVTLHDRELEIITDSLSIVVDAVEDRLRTLQAMYKLQNQDEKDQLKKFFYGLYRYAIAEPEFSPYWKRNPLKDARQIEESMTIDNNLAKGPLPLVYGPQIEDIVLLANRASAMIEPPVPSESSSDVTPHSLLGFWSGSFTYGDDNWGNAPFELSISSQAENGSTVNGSGIDPLGLFTVTGALDGNQLTFLKQYTDPQNGHNLTWRYVGEFNQEEDQITGTVTWSQLADDSHSVSSDGTSSDDAGRPFDHSNQDDMSTGSARTASDTSDSSTSAAPIGFGNFILKRGGFSDHVRIMGESLRRILTHSIRDADASSPLSQQSGVELSMRLGHGLLELLRSEQRHRKDPSEAQQWAELIEDVNLWDYIAMFKARRDYGKQDFSCDSCDPSGAASSFNSGTSVLRTRYMCINCSKDQLQDSIDLCAGCFVEQKSVVNGDSIIHNPTHNMLQLRTKQLRVYQYTLLSKGMSDLQRASRAVNEGREARAAATSSEPLPGPFCVDCKDPIEAPPYWFCIDCLMYEPTFVCYECNSRIDTEKPWLAAFVANTHNSHDWSHTLVSVPRPDVGAQADPASKSSTEELLAHLEERLDQRLEAMEKLLERLSSSV